MSRTLLTSRDVSAVHFLFWPIKQNYKECDVDVFILKKATSLKIIYISVIINQMIKKLISFIWSILEGKNIFP